MMQYNPGNLGIGANPINFNNTFTQPLVQPPQATTNFQASNADNSRRIRFDSKNLHGDVPHGHIEHYDKIANDWIDYTDKHRIYLRDAMEYLNKPKMGKE